MSHNTDNRSIKSDERCMNSLYLRQLKTDRFFFFEWSVQVLTFVFLLLKVYDTFLHGTSVTISVGEDVVKFFPSAIWSYFKRR